jgi:acyl-coenzyme A synthetase/AMP-(fatty) acid ligase
VRTAQVFVTLPHQEGRWYKTGDRVERDAAGIYHFMSRIDQMVKVRGHRIELGEVEQALRQVSGTDLVAVVPKPARDGMAQGLVAFVGTPGAYTGTGLREALARRLPKPMVPDEVRVVDGLPLNANRKIDRPALATLAATPASAAQGPDVPSNHASNLVHG